MFRRFAGDMDMIYESISTEEKVSVDSAHMDCFSDSGGYHA
jgi:hypothetical protein